MQYITLDHFINNKLTFFRHVMTCLHKKAQDKVFDQLLTQSDSQSSAVLLLLGESCGSDCQADGPCIVLNKRSSKVKQPGDLCCPGGSIDTRLDPMIAKLLKLPFSPLTRWPKWQEVKSDNQIIAQKLSLYLSTGIRESFEEMRLNPLGIQFLGPLSPIKLIMFDKVIYPMVAWINRQTHFFPNREVEKIVYIPIKQLLNARYYANYQLFLKNDNQSVKLGTYPCFQFKYEGKTERLWGATYRLTMSFLDTVFDFTPPAIEELPQVTGYIDQKYMGK